MSAPSRRRTVTHRPGGAGPRGHTAILVVAVLNAVAAAGGAWGLASGAIGIGPRLEARLPWHSPTLGGIALLLLVAVPNAVLAGLAWGGDRRTGPVSVATGALLVGWIVVELAFLRELSFFHPLYVSVGLLLVWLGRRASPPARLSGWDSEQTGPAG
ncbi:hypothetical protein [Nocardioides cynanchi]|uniref:hypothetical protein n=1 Tax=Nocardioides cynanchi TaxID=2558918 RepID=UPI001246A6BA|nr:hypothetical protein [Nocardioides cynanchi]